MTRRGGSARDPHHEIHALPPAAPHLCVNQTHFT